MSNERPLLVVTRPRAQAAELEAELERRGFGCMVEPLLEIVPDAGAPPPLEGVQALLLTSANAAPVLQRLESELPLYAVGEATAEAARAVHRGPVVASGGTATELARMVRQRLEPAAGALLHLSGREVRAELGKSLAAAGFALRRHIAYRAETADRLSSDLETRLRSGTVAGILLFSPRTAQVLVELVRARGLAAAFGSVEAVCLSPAVADAASGLVWRAHRVAASPRTAALLALLDGPKRRW